VRDACWRGGTASSGRRRPFWEIMRNEKIFNGVRLVPRRVVRAGSDRGSSGIYRVLAVVAFSAAVGGCAVSGGSGDRGRNKSERTLGVRFDRTPAPARKRKRREVKYLAPPPECNSPVIRKEPLKVIVIEGGELRRRYGDPNKRQDAEGGGAERGAASR